jgi:hypothetical protein
MAKAADTGILALTMKDFTERSIIPADPGYQVIRSSRIDQEAAIRHDPVIAWLIRYFEYYNTGSRKRACSP